MEVEIYNASGGYTVTIMRKRRMKYGFLKFINISRPSLLRAQRMQLLAYDMMKGQSPDGELELPNQQSQANH